MGSAAVSRGVDPAGGAAQRFVLQHGGWPFGATASSTLRRATTSATGIESEPCTRGVGNA